MATESDTGMSEGVRVLVVEDDELLRGAIRTALEGEGYTVLEAPDGVVALDIMRAITDPMVVVTDHNMPRLDGPGLFGFILNAPGLAMRHRFVYVTAGNRVLDPTFARELDLLGIRVMRKPFELDQFLTAIAEAAAHLSSSHPRHPTPEL
jgi:CheY-like chemotaxis protein